MKVAALFLVSVQSAVAADIKIEPRLSGGVSYYNLEFDDEVVVGTDSVDDIEFSDWLIFVGGGTTVSIDRFFIDLYGQYSFSGQDDLDLDLDAGGVIIEDLVQEVDFDRIETAITLGYRITDQLAGYIGYRYANVDFDGSGSLVGFGVDLSTDFKQKGPFIGLSYTVPGTVLNGAFVANGAIAFLDGDLSNELSAPAPINDVNFDVEGDAIGLNGGVSWATPLSESFRLVIGADVSSYSFEGDNNATDFDELIARLRAEVRYSFGTDSFFGD